MSHPARGPHSGIDGQTNVAHGRNGAHGMHEVLAEAECMSHPARDQQSGIDGQTSAAQGRNGVHGMHEVLAEAERLSFMMDTRWMGDMAQENGVSGLSLADGPSVSTSVRPGRVRNRTKTEVDEKVKKPTDESRKKTTPARKAPARGRYVDEYARPAF